MIVMGVVVIAVVHETKDEIYRHVREDFSSWP